MKVEIKEDFRAIQITLENQREVDVLFAVFNYRPIVDTLDVSDIEISEKLSSHHSNDYGKYHTKLVTKFP